MTPCIGSVVEQKPGRLTVKSRDSIFKSILGGANRL